MRINKKFRPRQRVNVIQKNNSQPAKSCPILITKISTNTLSGIDDQGNERIFDFTHFRPVKIAK